MACAPNGSDAGPPAGPSKRGLPVIRIGIDVGGTNTDAVLMQGTTILHAVKACTTEDVLGGVVMALRRLLDESDVSIGDVEAVMIGTTHFTNAVVQRRHLARTAAVRLGLPATACLPPMVDWPEDLREAVSGFWHAAATSSTVA